MSIEFGRGSKGVWLQMALIDQRGGTIVLPEGTTVALMATVLGTDVTIAGEIVNGQTGLCRFLMTDAILGVNGPHQARIKAVYPFSGPQPVSRSFPIDVE